MAAVTILGFSAFKITESKEGKLLAPVTIYFHGEADDPTQVAEESNWTDEPNEENCNDIDELACSMEVDESDLTPSGELDPSKIQLGATNPGSGSGFVPTRTGGNSQTPFNPTNRSE
ncbi:hypothetical protein H8B06_13055 [Sphingobacterium sp. DN00404]|uniref:Uncharacterized protein n=1 Tax=Sphingobacterium micropteri TaxID=2763501 RepID=A0ABR7YRC5_9SPHI|nr:hypothetical protein [Sphingobacterium micropteri]MBD1433761.1 hypothetical protein [Sphingobacterium micropteri]